MMSPYFLFSELSYSHIRRDDNKVAHSLARLILITLDCTVWMEDVPSRTLHFVQADLAVFLFYLMNCLQKKKNLAQS